MPFEIYPWQIREKGGEVFKDKAKTWFCFSFFDPFVENLTLKYLWKNHLSLGECRNIYGQDVTPDWLETNLCTQDLFGGERSFIIWQTDQMPKASVEYFIKEILNRLSGETTLYLSCSKKSLLAQKLEKIKEMVSVRIETPKFWDHHKYFDFLSKEFGVTLEKTARDFLLEVLPLSSAEIIPVLKFLRDFFGTSSVLSLEQVRTGVSSIYVDKFQAASCLGSKNFSDFYNTLLKLNGDFDELRQQLSFFQGHLLKFLDAEDFAGKGYLSKYDRQILEHSELWSAVEIYAFLDQLSKLEILAKSKNSGVWDSIRTHYLSHKNSIY